MPEYLYYQLEQQLRQQISSGQFACFSKLPSVRELCRQSKLSKSTVLAAYARLEADGLIQAKAKSGYFVCPNKAMTNNPLKTPATSSPNSLPRLISRTQLILDIMQRGAAFDLLSKSAPQPHNEQLRKALSRALRRQNSDQQLYYDQPQGDKNLRLQLAKSISHGGGQLTAQELIVTSGCQHSLLLALMATTEPGDLVAIESPGFYGALQLLEVLGRKVLEIPSSATDGISPDALQLATEHWNIKALIISPSFATPTGSCMPEENKRRVLHLAQQKNFAIIEDDIYAELHFSLQRPRSLHSYDNTGSVLLCSSLAKTLSRDLRIGWIAAGKYHQKILGLKVATSMANSVSQQQGVALFMAEGGLEKHLKVRRQQLQTQKQQLQSLISEYLPMAQSASQPQGGMVLWLELDKKINSLELYRQAREQGLTITPGSIFSAQDTYQNFLRLSFAHPWTPQRITAIKQLATLITEY
ncbi:MAG: PLP-dependent aminotransferase family protein [Pseudomonadales bacterium]|nr:PLP-dependent aminotransferase family protein [Pseudomonadales bacterium]NRA17690.1 PLP-dependent aminotransferase family protein [Oceanospirillaceae bacterium]